MMMISARFLKSAAINDIAKIQPAGHDALIPAVAFILIYGRARRHWGALDGRRHGRHDVLMRDAGFLEALRHNSFTPATPRKFYDDDTSLRYQRLTMPPGLSAPSIDRLCRRDYPEISLYS